MLPIKRPGRLLAATAAVALLASAPTALAARTTISGKINPDKGPIGSPIRLTIGFTADPDPGKEPGTIRKVEIFLPPNARQNGARFPSCSAAAINAVRGRFTNCPKGSQIGTGSGRGDVPAIPVNNVPIRFTFFNGPGGRSVTVHVYATNPVLISEAYDSPLIRTKGRFGYHFVSPVPYRLQEINDGWFVGVRSFTSTIGATWRRIPYIQSTTLCPRSLSVPIAARFEFLRDNEPTTNDSVIRCRR